MVRVTAAWMATPPRRVTVSIANKLVLADAVRDHLIFSLGGVEVPLRSPGPRLIRVIRSADEDGTSELPEEIEAGVFLVWNSSDAWSQ